MATTQPVLVEVDTTSSPNHLVSYEYEYGSEEIWVRAYIEDCVMVYGGNLIDPPEFGSAICYTSFLWGEDINSHNAPKQKDIELFVSNNLDSGNWTIEGMEEHHA